MAVITSKSVAVVSSMHENSIHRMKILNPTPEFQEKIKEKEISQHQETIQKKSLKVE